MYAFKVETWLQQQSVCGLQELARAAQKVDAPVILSASEEALSNRLTPATVEGIFDFCQELPGGLPGAQAHVQCIRRQQLALLSGCCTSWQCQAAPQHNPLPRHRVLKRPRVPGLQKQCLSYMAASLEHLPPLSSSSPLAMFLSFFKEQHTLKPAKRGRMASWRRKDAPAGCDTPPGDRPACAG